jgi:hypothetical protein
VADLGTTYGSMLAAGLWTVAGSTPSSSVHRSSGAAVGRFSLVRVMRTGFSGDADPARGSG